MIDQDNFLENIPEEIKVFLVENGLKKELNSLHSLSKTKSHFKTRFFEWFNGFKVLKCVHFLRDHYFPNQPLKDVCKEFLIKLKNYNESSTTIEELLKVFRILDKQGSSNY